MLRLCLTDNARRCSTRGDPGSGRRSPAVAARVPRLFARDPPHQPVAIPDSSASGTSDETRWGRRGGRLAVLKRSARACYVDSVPRPSGGCSVRYERPRHSTHLYPPGSRLAFHAVRAGVVTQRALRALFPWPTRPFYNARAKSPVGNLHLRCSGSYESPRRWLHMSGSFQRGDWHPAGTNVLSGRYSRNHRSSPKDYSTQHLRTCYQAPI